MFCSSSWTVCNVLHRDFKALKIWDGHRTCENLSAGEFSKLTQCHCSLFMKLPMQWGPREMVGCACSWLLHYKGNQLLTFSLSLVILLQAHQQSMRWNELFRNLARQQCTTSKCVFDVLICISVKFHISSNLNCWHLSAVSCFPNPHSH